jgi:divalent metal cation (Fe/Co/Zn/Cd) transporter
MGLAKKATLVASVTAFSLTIMKLVVGIMTSSVAVISSAVDSLLDTCVSIFNAFAVKESEKESDEEYNH